MVADLSKSSGMVPVPQACAGWNRALFAAQFSQFMVQPRRTGGGVWVDAWITETGGLSPKIQWTIRTALLVPDVPTTPTLAQWYDELPCLARVVEGRSAARSLTVDLFPLLESNAGTVQLSVFVPTGKILLVENYTSATALAAALILTDQTAVRSDQSS